MIDEANRDGDGEVNEKSCHAIIINTIIIIIIIIFTITIIITPYAISSSSCSNFDQVAIDRR